MGFKAGLGTSWQTIGSPSTNNTPVLELLAFHCTDQAAWMFTLQNSSRNLMSNRLKMQRASAVFYQLQFVWLTFCVSSPKAVSTDKGPWCS